MKSKYTFMEMVDLSYSDHYREFLHTFCWEQEYIPEKHDSLLDLMVKDLVFFDDYLSKYNLSLAV